MDFGYNRTKALTTAFGKTDYLLIFDADDKIMGDLKLPSALTCDKFFAKCILFCYHISSIITIIIYKVKLAN